MDEPWIRQRCSEAQLATLSVDNDLELTAAACAPAPKQLGSMIVASVALNTDGVGLLSVSLLDSHGESKARGTFEVSEDAALRFEASSLWIDVAPYRLAPDVRAFGIDITSAYIPNCGDGGFGAVRTLYALSDGNIVPVLRDLYMTEWTYLKQPAGRCNPDPEAPDVTVVEEFAKTVQMAETVTNGRQDLVIVGTAQVRSTSAVGSETVEPSTRGRFRHVLKFDGRVYPTTELETAWWKWRE